MSMAYASDGRTGRRRRLLLALAARPRPVRRQRRARICAAERRPTVRIALDYSANVNYLGIYVALAKGWFADAGVDAKIIPYANTPAETLVQSGATDLGISYPPDVIINRARGLRYRAVAALVAHNTTALAVLASSRVHEARPAERHALRRLRDRERQADRVGDPARRRRREARLQAGRAADRRVRRPLEGPHPVHGRVRRDRRRDGPARGLQAAALPLPALPRRRRRLPERGVRRERRGDREGRTARCAPRSPRSPAATRSPRRIPRRPRRC